ncbi:protocatechuate 3,4-dioxygenase beta subunit [Pontibacter aydingkolensis]|uniref:Intradiol ring-cleavage dioxygenase n=1 Tax=Pontibacter aydingkolensis TaxID=1911536 RepID=A0ABS7CRY6_9BACT|nr:intradiol ring-cleavage dioxygenase [Pontibacter aydingkolensis]MBW7466585.1 intradiol ring-cleavage dioxygenase [Pontibacter aydingkolensis]
MYGACLYFKIALPILLTFTSCNGQSAQNQQTDAEALPQDGPRVGGRCETCELMYVGMPKSINATDTSAAWNSGAQKLILTGTVYKTDKKTPAKDVILYYWQTDENGIYADKPDLDSKVRRHGYIRGWLKTDKQSRYTIYTIRPGSYPNSNNPQHIHMLVKESRFPNEYYIDDIHFEDDPLLTDRVKKQMHNIGGNGIVNIQQQNGMQKANRDIILGLNVSDYPKK